LNELSNCGACQHSCSLSGAKGSACTSGLCTPTCAPRYADCNQAAGLTVDDGCESYLDSLEQCTKGCNLASVACAASEVCNDGTCVAPAGIAILSVPLAANMQRQRFADLFGPVELEGATLTVRVYAPGATGGTLSIYVSDADFSFAPQMLEVDLTSISTKWRDLSIQIASTGAFDATQVRQVNLDVNSATGPWTNPTVLYVDSVRTSNLRVNDTFDASFGKFLLSSLVAVPGSTITWAESVP
jgi:hypothetical protein